MTHRTQAARAVLRVSTHALKLRLGSALPASSNVLCVEHSGQLRIDCRFRRASLSEVSRSVATTRRGCAREAHRAGLRVAGKVCRDLRPSSELHRASGARRGEHEREAPVADRSRNADARERMVGRSGAVIILGNGARSALIGSSFEVPRSAEDRPAVTTATVANYARTNERT